MTQHAHSTFQRGCYRCDLSLDESDSGVVAIRREDLLALTNAVANERAAIVAMCDERADAAESQGMVNTPGILRDIARAIKSGEHR